MFTKSNDPALEMFVVLGDWFKQFRSDKTVHLSMTIDSAALVLQDRPCTISMNFNYNGDKVVIHTFHWITDGSACTVGARKEFRLNDLPSIEDHVIATFDL